MLKNLVVLTSLLSSLLFYLVNFFPEWRQVVLGPISQTSKTDKWTEYLLYFQVIFKSSQITSILSGKLHVVKHMLNQQCSDTYPSSQISQKDQVPKEIDTFLNLCAPSSTPVCAQSSWGSYVLIVAEFKHNPFKKHTFGENYSP